MAKAYQSKGLWDLHSYNLNWAVCHLFPQQRWRTHANIQFGKPLARRTTWSVFKTASTFEFRPAFFGADFKTRIFYLYFVFKHSLFPNFYCSANTLSPVWLSYSPTDVKSHKMDKPRKPSFPQYSLSVRLFPASKTAIVSNHRKKRTFRNT